MHRRIRFHSSLEKLALKFSKDRLLFVIIGLFVTLLTFGFTMAQNGVGVIILPNNAALAETNLSALAVDMSFEAKQVARDLEILKQSITTTERAVQNSTFNCEALNTAKTHKDILNTFLLNTKNINTKATAEDIYRAYEQYDAIRGNERQTGIRQALYGGYNPVTEKNDVSNLSQLSTCVQIAAAVTKSCNAYSELTRQVSTKTSQSSAVIEASKTLHFRCTTPNAALTQARVTIVDLTPINSYEKNCRNKSVGGDILFSTETILNKNGTVSCNALIEKYLGPSSIMRRLKKLRNF